MSSPRKAELQHAGLPWVGVPQGPSVHLTARLQAGEDPRPTARQGLQVVLGQMQEDEVQPTVHDHNWQGLARKDGRKGTHANR